jgi:hypothetical protein
MSLESSAVTHFLWLKHTPKEEILSELDDDYGTDVIRLRAVKNWTTAFDGECTELVDSPRSVRRRDTGKVDAVRAMIDGEGYLSQKKTA